MSRIYAKSLPIKEVITGIDCDVNGVHKPIVFEFIRGDVAGYIINNAGDTQIVNADTTNFSELVLGDFVDVIEYENIGGLISIISITRAEVINIIDVDNIIVDIPFVAPANCFVNIVKRSGWYCEVKIKGFKLGELTESIIGVLKIDAKDYLINFNVSPFLRSLVEMKDNFDYTALGDSVIGREMSYVYRLALESIWVGGSSTEVFGYDVTQFYKYFNGVKQIGELYGNNFADYFLVGDPAKKSLLFNGVKDVDLNTDFIGDLNYYRGLPISIGFFSNSLAGYELKTFITQINQNNVQIATNNYPQSTDGLYRIRKIKDSEVSNPLTKFFLLQMKYVETAGINVYEATNEYKYDIIDYCKENSVYLNWLHPSGARLFYLFQRNNIKGLTTKTIDSYNPYFADIETQSGDAFITGKEVTPSLTIGGVDTIKKYKWIKTLLYSSNILMLTNPDSWETDGAIWQNVNIPDGSFTLEQATDSNVEFAFTIILPKINTQSE